MNFNIDRPVCIQDTVHIATKLKTKLLNVESTLLMGTYEVSPEHIELLIKTFPKDKHLLCRSDLQSIVLQVIIK